MLGMEKLQEDFFPKKQGCSIFLGKQNKISDSDFHSHHLWMTLPSFFPIVTAVFFTFDEEIE